MRRRLAKQSAPKARECEMRKVVLLFRRGRGTGDRRERPTTKTAACWVVYGSADVCVRGQDGAIDRECGRRYVDGACGGAVELVGGWADAKALVEWISNRKERVGASLHRLRLPHSLRGRGSPAI
jgi:hypothetical protein